MQLGKKIKNLRREKNLTQRQLGQQIGIHEKNIGAYEKEISIPSSDILKKLSQVLEVTADYLLNDDMKRTQAFTIKDQELLKMLQEADKINDGDRFVIKRIIKAVLKDTA